VSEEPKLRRCDYCGRQSYTREGEIDTFPQPDRHPCGGRFRAVLGSRGAHEETLEELTASWRDRAFQACADLSGMPGAWKNGLCPRCHCTPWAHAWRQATDELTAALRGVGTPQPICEKCGEAIVAMPKGQFDAWQGQLLKLEAEVETLKAQVTGLLPPQCATCQGRGWVMRSSFQDHGNGQGSGGMWNEPCPDCASSPSLKETP